MAKPQIKYYYAKAEDLQKYFQNIPQFSKLKIKLSQQIVDLVNRVINDKINPGNLAFIFKQLEDRYPSSVIKLFVEATKEFLASDYFSYPGKRTTRSWFGGAIKLVSENPNNPTIRLFNDVLNPLIAVYDAKIKSQSKSLSTDVQITNHIRNASAKKNQHVNLKISGNTYFVIAAGVIISIQAVLGQEHVVDHQQNIFGLKNLPIATILDRLPEFYHIATNAPIDKVTLWGFGEDHGNYTHHKLLMDIIPAIGKPGDLVLIEGIESGVEFPCSQLCIAKNGKEELQRNLKDCIENYGFDKFKCFGSDKKQIVNGYFSQVEAGNKLKTKTEKMKKAKIMLVDLNTALSDILNLMQNNPTRETILKSVKEIYNQIITFSKDIPGANQMLKDRLPILKEYIKAYEDSAGLYDSAMTFVFGPVSGLKPVVNFVGDCLKLVPVMNGFVEDVNKQIATESQQIANELQGYTDAVIIAKRNKEGLIKTLEMPHIKAYKGNKFILWGGGHYFPDPNNPKRNPNPNESQRELRDYFNQFSHWIGFPK